MVPQVLLFFSFTCWTDTNCFRNLTGFVLFWLSYNSSEPWDFHHPTSPAPSTSWTSKTPRQTLNKHGSPLCSHLLTSLQFNHHRRSRTHRCMQQTSWCSSSWVHIQCFLPPFNLRGNELLHLYENMAQSVKAAQKSTVNIKCIISNFVLNSKR